MTTSARRYPREPGRTPAAPNQLPAPTEQEGRRPLCSQGSARCGRAWPERRHAASSTGPTCCLHGRHQDGSQTRRGEHRRRRLHKWGVHPAQAAAPAVHNPTSWPVPAGSAEHARWPTWSSGRQPAMHLRAAHLLIAPARDACHPAEPPALLSTCWQINTPSRKIMLGPRRAG